MTIEHKDITGTDAVHPSDFYQSADPGAVGANKSWIDTTATPPTLKRRNAADSGWDTINDPSLYQTKALLTTLGDTIYATSSSVWTRLAGNTTATKKFLRQTGSGAVSAAPAWDTLVAGDIPSLDASKITTGTLSSATMIPSLDAAKITTGSFTASRIGSIEPNFFFGHINGGGGLDIQYPLGCTSTVTATGAPTANRMYAVPFVGPGRGGTINQIAFQVTTLLAGNGRVGIYDATSDSNIYPNALIVDGGGVSTATTGFKTAAVSVALTPGKLYWAVYLGDAAPTLRVLNTGAGNGILGVDTTLVSTPNRGISVAQAYGALPGTFTAGAVTESTSVVPIVYAKYSA